MLIEVLQEKLLAQEKTYTETRIRCYIGIISRILTDSYRGNKREYGLHVFMESLYNKYGEITQKIYRKILFCIQPYSAWIGENTVQKTPVFTVVLCSESSTVGQDIAIDSQDSLFKPH